ncbi:Uncharacterised protein [Mycobacteroides abscessus subsp. abscessus]|nr:Uncharacterised protein [Mycobacteroides abscessus subsp. abscessus]
MNSSAAASSAACLISLSVASGLPSAMLAAMVSENRNGSSKTTPTAARRSAARTSARSTRWAPSAPTSRMWPASGA